MLQSWVDLFFCKEFMMILVPYLPLQAIFQLTGACSTMRQKWCGDIGGNSDWRKLLDMQKRILDHFNIDFKGANPFFFLGELFDQLLIYTDSIIVKAAQKARIRPKHAHAKARCFGSCGGMFYGFQLISRKLYP
jgi:hypothetical protein